MKPFLAPLVLFTFLKPEPMAKVGHCYAHDPKLMQVNVLSETKTHFTVSGHFELYWFKRDIITKRKLETFLEFFRFYEVPCRCMGEDK